MQIVALIRKSKNRRQLLFTTHNPNIVVNGDADKVIALRSGESARDDTSDGRIQVDVDGAIETPEIRKVITRIMEGGKETFPRIRLVCALDAPILVNDFSQGLRNCLPGATGMQALSDEEERLPTSKAGSPLGMRRFRPGKPDGQTTNERRRKQHDR